MGIDDAVDIAARTLLCTSTKTRWNSSSLPDTMQMENQEIGKTENRGSFDVVLNENGTAALSNIKSIAVGYATSYAVTENGEVYAWGYNNYGQIGNKGTGSKTLPYKTSLTNIKEVVGGECFTLALSNDGTVFGTGRNSEGQLGIANSSDTNEWQKMKDTDGVTELTGVKQVACRKISYSNFEK